MALVVALGVLGAIGSVLVPTLTIAAGNTLRIEPATASVVAVGDTLVIRVVQNAEVPTSGVRATLTFDPALLRVVSITRDGTPWAAAPSFVPQDLEDATLPATTVFTANTVGVLRAVAATMVTGSVPTGDQDFLLIQLRVVACGRSELGLPVGPEDGGLLSGSDESYGAPLAVTASGWTVEVPCPTTEPSPEPSASLPPEPSPDPTTEPSPEPSASLPPEPSPDPTTEPRASPTPTGSPGPIPDPILTPIPETTVAATPAPTFPPAALALALPAGDAAGNAVRLGVAAPEQITIPLARNAFNTVTVPIAISGTASWTLSVSDLKRENRGRMTAVGQPAVVLQSYLQVMVPPNRGLRLDAEAGTVIYSGSGDFVAQVTIGQRIGPFDPPGKYTIVLVFRVISGF